MSFVLTEEQTAAAASFRAFAREHVAPLAAAIDRDERVPAELVTELARRGYLGSGIAVEHGGAGHDPLTHGLLHEELAAVSASVQGLVNVHHMAAASIQRWGTKAQKQEWLPRLARGELLAGFALTEAAAGSDGQVATRADREGATDGYRLTGRKKWITAGAAAGVFVLLARAEGGATAFVVPATSAGFERRPIPGMLGCRGYMLAELVLEGCAVAAAQRLGGEGFGLSHVMTAGLDQGRYNLAWGCAGIARACLEASLGHAERRQQFGGPLLGHQLVQRLITRMIAGTRSARALCVEAAASRARRSPSAFHDAMIAKYHASTALAEIADAAVQVHGALGCSDEAEVARYLRDARIMEIIEGSTQMLELMIAQLAGGAAS
jgi:glutaryl-CoA dehydrogenase (non-decarboxylating)